MINSILDLKNRTLVESNILKSFILTNSNEDFSPSRDDILIHDYQIANSVTINSILSNYVVNIRHAWSLLDTYEESEAERYFKILDGLDKDSLRDLDGSTKLVLDVSEG